MNLDDKTLLITGGTGSFGTAVLNYFIDKFKQIRIFSRDEKKQDDLRKQLRNKKVEFFIGDVRDQCSLDFAMKNVDFVFHAAALKQVPSCEFHPLEAVKTNIMGSQNVINAMKLHNVSRGVFLSTDKAAYPINAMGISKAMMEKVVSAESRVNSENILSLTRYGNVMGSRGSVIPLFIDQLKNKKQITVTNPEMTRFMMSLDESVDLVKFAFMNAKGGELFVKKSPSSTIIDLVAALESIFNTKADIRIIGTRHSEKLYETLLTSEEYAQATDLGDFFSVPLDSRDLNYDIYFTEGSVENNNDEISFNSHNAQRLSVDELAKKLIDLPFVKEALKA